MWVALSLSGFALVSFVGLIPVLNSEVANAANHNCPEQKAQAKAYWNPDSKVLISLIDFVFSCGVVWVSLLSAVRGFIGTFRSITILARE